MFSSDYDEEFAIDFNKLHNESYESSDDDQEIQVVSGSRDQVKLVNNGHTFIRNGRTMPKKDRMTWICEERDCKKRLITTKAFAFLNLVGKHIDLPNPAKVDILKAKQFIKEQAVMNFIRRPSEIHKDAMHKFSSVKNFLGTDDTIGHLVNSARRRLLKSPEVSC